MFISCPRSILTVNLWIRGTTSTTRISTEASQAGGIWVSPDRSWSRGERKRWRRWWTGCWTSPLSSAWVSMMVASWSTIPGMTALTRWRERNVFAQMTRSSDTWPPSTLRIIPICGLGRNMSSSCWSKYFQQLKCQLFSKHIKRAVWLGDTLPTPPKQTSWYLYQGRKCKRFLLSI